MINGKKIIAVCTSRIYDHQHFSFLAELSEFLLPYNCNVMIFTLTSDLYWVEDANSPECYVFDIIPFDKIECLVLMDEKIKSHRVAGKIVSDAAKHSVPVIVVDGKYEGVTTVSFDYEMGFERVVRHVIEHHSVKKPHFIAGMKDNPFSDARLAIFRKVIEENGIPFDDSMVSYGDFWSLPARNATQKLIDSGNIPEAVICANDIMAINVSDVFIKAGIKVPEQVIVTGFDGIDEALLTTPQLTTAGCDSTDLSEAVGKCICDIIAGKKPKDISIVPKLSPNASCGCEYIPTDTNSRMNDFNNRFYRYQDDNRVLYDVSTKMQMSSSPEEASSYLNNYIIHDMCCIVKKKCFDNKSNYFSGTDNDNEMCIFHDSYDPESVNKPFKVEDLVPDIDKRLSTGIPIVFNTLDFMSKPFGYICFSFGYFDINEFTRSASITNTVSMGIGGYVNMHFQKFLTDKMTAELKVAAEMQKNMLPTSFVEHPRYNISASMTPAKNVGGDFYDFFHIDATHLGLIIADVSGKGVPAALFMATSKLIIHERALQPGTPAEILRDVNKHICDNNKMSLFITIWFGILDLDTGIVTYASAGHEYPAVKLDGDGFRIVRNDNLPPIGVSEDIEYNDLTIDLSSGGSLFLYTDGVTDVKNENGEHFGLERTTELLNKLRECSPKELIKKVNNVVNEFSGNLERFDDTTMMCVAFKGK